jgi:hypothetical protein
MKPAPLVTPLGNRDWSGLKKLAAEGSTPWEPGNQNQALRLLCSAVHEGKALSELTPAQLAELTKTALDIDPTLALSEERRTAWLARQAAAAVETHKLRAVEKRAAESLRASQEAERVAAFESSVAWQDARTRAGLPHDLNPNNASLEDRRRHREALTAYRETIAPHIQKMLGGE